MENSCPKGDDRITALNECSTQLAELETELESAIQEESLFMLHTAVARKLHKKEPTHQNYKWPRSCCMNIMLIHLGMILYTLKCCKVSRDHFIRNCSR